MSIINLHNCDCMEFMKGVKDKAYDVAIVDPPYGIGMGATLNVNSNVKFIDKEWDLDIPDENYFNELFRVSKNQVIWGGNYFPFIWKQGCKEYIFWNKLNHHDNRSDGELAWTSFNGLCKYFEYMWDGNRYGEKGRIKGVGAKTIRIHPTEKPVAVYKWILKTYGTPGDRILDTHGGSMSIAIAAYDLGFDLDLCELDPDYFKAGQARLDAHIAKYAPASEIPVTKKGEIKLF